MILIVLCVIDFKYLHDFLLLLFFCVLIQGLFGKIPSFIFSLTERAQKYIYISTQTLEKRLTSLPNTRFDVILWRY